MDLSDEELEQARSGVDSRSESVSPRDPVVTRSRLLPLNSSRLATYVIRRVAVEMELPGNATRADTLSMIEGKLTDAGEEPRNVQVKLTEEEETLKAVELVTERGPFLRVEIEPEEELEEPLADLEGEDETQDGTLAEQLRRTQARLLEAQARNETLAREVSELSAQLERATARVKELWSDQCALSVESDRQLVQAEIEIEQLKSQLAGNPTVLVGDTLLPSRTSTVPKPTGRPVARTPVQRRGRAPPVEPFAGEVETQRVDDWLPTLERAATWNEWTEDELLLQLAGHLRGRALQEWELLSEDDRGSYSQAVTALRTRLDPGSKTLAAQDFRHTTQREAESVADFIRRLERTFRVAYGRDGIASEARDALLYGQLHEGLKYEIIRAPGVSGVDSYSSLCLAAKNEERRLQELEKREQYGRSESKLPSRTPPPSKHKPGTASQGKHREQKSSLSSSTGAGNGNAKRVRCFVCDQIGHYASSCPSKRTESKGSSNSKHGSGNKTRVKMLTVTDDSTCNKASLGEGTEDLLGMLLSDSDEEHVNLIQLRDKGSSARGASVQIQGVPAVGVLDSGSDITIMGAKLFAKVALAARLRKRDFKKPDRIPRTYDQRTFTLDGRLDLDIEFGGKSMKTPVYVRREAKEQLLLSEGVCRQLGMIVYHSEVGLLKDLAKDPPGPSDSPKAPDTAQVPMVRVYLNNTVNVLPHQSIGVSVSIDSQCGRAPLLVEPVKDPEHVGVHVDEALISPPDGRVACVVVSNMSGVSCQLEEGTCVGTLTEVSVVEQGEHSGIVSAVHRVATEQPVVSGTRHQELLEVLKESSLLNDEQRSVFCSFLTGFHDVFARDDGDRGETDLTEMTIDTGDSTPKRIPARRMPLAVRREVSKQLQDMQAAGIIQPSESPWSSPVVMVKKKDGTQRFCVDYRALNAVTKADRFPLPRIDDLLDQLGNSRYFSTLDLARGFWQIRLSPNSIEKTAFAVPQGLFEFRVMPFGLTNAPAVFQRLMERVLAGLNPEEGPDFVKVYIDDVIVFSPTLEDHLQHLQQVLQRIRDAGLKLKTSKCRFIAEEVEYLGHILTPSGLKPNPNTTSAVADFPLPANLKEVRQFLGLSSYYRRFISGFATIAQPLHQLTRKGVHFKWDARCQEAFEQLKRLLTSSPVLAYPQLAEPFVLETDASIQGLGAILSQRQSDGNVHPVAYASRSLSQPERNYGITELETLAVVWAVTHFKAYLYGNKVTIYSDHSAVKAVLNTPNPSGKHARWWTRVYGSGINEVNIVYRPGKHCANADALSRSPQPTVAIVSSKENIPELLASSDAITPPHTSYSEEQRKDPHLLTVITFLETKTLPADGNTARKLALQAPLYVLMDGVLCFLGGKQLGGRRVVVPSHLKESLMDRTHRGRMSGHFSGPRVYKTLAKTWWWDGMYVDCEKHAKSCPECLIVRGSGRKERPPLHPIEVSRPFQIVGVDIMDLPLTNSGNKHVLVFQDYFTKWPLVYPIPDQKTQRIVDILVHDLVPVFGTPESLLSDRGTNLLSHLMTEVCKALGINKLNTTAYHPQCDGLVERFNRTLKAMLRKHAFKYGKEWDRYLYGVLWAYRNTPHDSTGEKPSYLLFGRDLRSPVEAELLTPTLTPPTSAEEYKQQLLQTLAHSRHLAESATRQAQSRYKANFDKKATQRQYREGDWVMIKFPQEEQGKGRKLSHPWHGPYRILTRDDPNVTVSKVYYPQEAVLRVHQERVCFCPSELPAGFFWYGRRRHSPGRPPRWVQLLMERGTPESDESVGDPDYAPAESTSDPGDTNRSDVSVGDPDQTPAESHSEPGPSDESLGEPDVLPAESCDVPGTLADVSASEPATFHSPRHTQPGVDQTDEGDPLDVGDTPEPPGVVSMREAGGDLPDGLPDDEGVAVPEGSRSGTSQTRRGRACSQYPLRARVHAPARLMRLDGAARDDLSGGGE